MGEDVIINPDIPGDENVEVGCIEVGGTDAGGNPNMLDGCCCWGMGAVG